MLNWTHLFFRYNVEAVALLIPLRFCSRISHPLFNHLKIGLSSGRFVTAGFIFHISHENMEINLDD